MEARVSLCAAIPAGMTGRVSFKIFDPKNAHAELHPDVFPPVAGDNYGEMVFSSNGNSGGSVSMYIQAGESYVTIGFEIKSVTDPNNPANNISPHAGDNYIVAAHPNPTALNSYRFYTEADAIASGSNPNKLPLNKINTWLIFPNHNKTTTSPGNPPVGYAFLTQDSQPKYYHTSTLTVWRTLWVERDQISLPPNNIIKADFPLIGDFLTTAFAGACIEIKPYPSTLNTTTCVPGLEEMPVDADWNGATSAIAAACRNSPQPTNTFWTIHMIGAFNGGLRPGQTGVYGRCYDGHNTIFIFNWKIKNYVDLWNNNSGPNSQIPLDYVQRWVALHELGHAFLGAGHSSGIMTGAGIPSGDTFLNYMDPQYGLSWKFDASQIQIIQSQLKPQ